jgi:hypothetical protein
VTFPKFKTVQIGSAYSHQLSSACLNPVSVPTLADSTPGHSASPVSITVVAAAVRWKGRRTKEITPFHN